MGATQSTVVSNDDLRNYIYGTVVLMLAPQLDAQLQFKPMDKITDEDKRTLPIVTDRVVTTLEETVAEYTKYYGTRERDYIIDKYVAANILDTQEHLSTFMLKLVSMLRDNRQSAVVANIDRLRNRSRGRSVPQESFPENTRTEGLSHLPERSERTGRVVRSDPLGQSERYVPERPDEQERHDRPERQDEPDGQKRQDEVDGQERQDGPNGPEQLTSGFNNDDRGREEHLPVPVARLERSERGETRSNYKIRGSAKLKRRLAEITHAINEQQAYLAATPASNGTAEGEYEQDTYEDEVLKIPAEARHSN